MKFVIVPYKIGSTSAKKLQKSIINTGHKCLRVRPDSRTYRPKPTDRIIYYGGSTANFQSNFVINPCRTLANNKLETFKKLKEANLSTVPWTTDREEATRWYFNNIPFMSRATLTGHSGQGITIFDKKPDDWEKYSGDIPLAPLYTKYVKKTYECRVHVYKGRVIDAQIKRKRTTNVEMEADTYIRNAHTGWVYCRDNFTPDQRAINLSIAACNACNLTFGAVDLIYNQHYNEFYILEINTAPGLEGTTLHNYTQAILNY